MKFEIGKIYYKCNIHKQFGKEVDRLELIREYDDEYKFKMENGCTLGIYKNLIKDDYKIRETIEEAQKDYNDLHNNIRQMIEGKDGMITYLLDKLDQLCKQDEYGYVFTPDELEIFNTALKEKYNKEFKY